MMDKGENKFVWPVKKEELLVAKTGIFTRLDHPPIPVSTRYLGFDPALYRSVTARVATYLLENRNVMVNMAEP